MKTIYFDCGMGAAGDMLTAALLELCPERKEEFLKIMNGLGLPGVRIEAETAVKCGITGTHMNVTVHGEEEESVDVHEHSDACANGLPHEHEHVHEHADGGPAEHAHFTPHEHAHEHEHGHAHSGMAEITHRIAHLDLPDEVKHRASEVYGLIAEAEGHVHGKPADQIHFHEVGTADALADVIGVCLLLYWLKPERILASPVHVGSGQVRCAHGILPVPAPATAYILRDVPIYGGRIRGELCTPTGAALLKEFVTEFGDMPVMKVSGTGYGMGKKDFEQANCVRALLGETDACDRRNDGAEGGATGEIVELSCNLDDMTAEAIGFAQEVLLSAGALDVYTLSAGMKKNRPGTILTCMCRPQDREKFVRLIFAHTTTIGVRENVCRRYVLKREERTAETPDGRVREKISSGYGVTRRKPEYEDLAEIARRTGKTLEEVRSSFKEVDN